MENILKLGSYFIIVFILAVNISKYLYKIYQEEKNWLSKLISPLEKGIYHLLGIEQTQEMGAKKYLTSILIFSLISFLFLILLLQMQEYLPFNQKKVEGMPFGLAFHTASSYVTNTNYQNYKGEQQVSEFVQMIGLSVQNFLSASIGICVLFALLRGITQVGKKTIGNFWKDLTRVTLYIFLPFSIIVSLVLVGTGVVQTLQPSTVVETLEGEEQILPLGPVASQEAIKQLGSNGGGYFSSNSAHPFENPNGLSNFIEMTCILIIPVSLVFLFGRVVKDKKQARAIFTIMITLVFVSLISIIGMETTYGTMEGKEARFGIFSSSLWSSLTTVTSNGSTNSSLESYQPLSKAMFLFQMGLGEVGFGGVGVGLYTMIGFLLLSVFLAGLMIGRTPEYLGKKIEVWDMKMVLLMILTTPLVVLILSSIGIGLKLILPAISAGSSEGFTQMLYAFLSAGANNGSGFRGFQVISASLNLLLAICMLLARFLPIAGVLFLAESLGKKQMVATTLGTLQTHRGIFIGMTLVVIFIIGGLSFFPSIVLGPLAGI